MTRNSGQWTANNGQLGGGRFFVLQVVLGVLFAAITRLQQRSIELLFAGWGRSLMGWLIGLIGVVSCLTIALFAFVKFNDEPTRIVIAVMLGALMIFVYVCIAERSAQR